MLVVAKLTINRVDRRQVKVGWRGIKKRGGVLTYSFLLLIEDFCFFKVLLVTAPFQGFRT